MKAAAPSSWARKALRVCGWLTGGRSGRWKTWLQAREGGSLGDVQQKFKTRGGTLAARKPRPTVANSASVPLTASTSPRLLPFSFSCLCPFSASSQPAIRTSGTCVSVAQFHLFRTLDGQTKRFNKCAENDAGRFVNAIKRVSGRRLVKPGESRKFGHQQGGNGAVEDRINLEATKPGAGGDKIASWFPNF